MEQDLMKSFMVIGRCNGMQTLSLGQVLELVNGVPYDIDLRPGGGVVVGETRLEDLPTENIIGILLHSPPKVPALPAEGTSKLDWDLVDEFGRQIREEEEEEEWEEKYGEKIPAKKAYKKWKKKVDEWMNKDGEKKKKKKKKAAEWEEEYSESSKSTGNTYAFYLKTRKNKHK